ncbi:MAG: hypothetical protein CVU73_15775 [Deltaproteobacteria bacterium HGW-Deltaproteobacteria-8]|jgi:hypothetical protein|nr:MAG: hypothetical protein CVU73_15775 [Deltaproteobacteria bacterium HGW-Deltaproteobacteria-8]
MNGVERINAERERQKTVKGYTPEHDLQHSYTELAQASSCYLAVDPEPIVRLRWPWSPASFKRKNFPRPSIRDMEKGGALAAAAIDLRLAHDPTEDAG